MAAVSAITAFLGRARLPKDLEKFAKATASR
jgi:hypothetical protein